MEALALIEVTSWVAAIVMVDAMEKHARIRLLQSELNDAPGVCLKLYGGVADVESTLRAAGDVGDAMHAQFLRGSINSPSGNSRSAWQAPAEFNPLIEQLMVRIPEAIMNKQSSFALGLIETQGFTAIIEAIDTAVKTAAVEVLAREKLGGGYITIVIKGDVGSVRAAVEAGKQKVEGLGRLVAAHVIPNPSDGVLALLAKV